MGEDEAELDLTILGMKSHFSCTFQQPTCKFSHSLITKKKKKSLKIELILKSNLLKNALI